MFYSIVRQAANACEPVQVGLETANVRVLWNGYPVVKPFKVPPVGDLIVESFDLHVTERAIWRQEMAWVRST